MTLKGMREVEKTFAALTGSKQRKYVRQGARAGGSVLMKATKARAPDRKSRNSLGKLTGLKRAMKQVPSSKWSDAAKMRREGIIGTRIGFDKKRGAHAHLVEYGHRQLTHDRQKPTKGKTRVPPYPFMRPAADASRSAMREAFRKKIAEGIKRNSK